MSFGGQGRKSSSGGAGSRGDYFESVTGRSEYERQSWRDSYNGGLAAGDITGNINERLDQERSDFQGATWSGSSSQPSALQWAQMGGGVASGHVSTPGGAASAGPGNSGAASASTGGKPVAGPGSGGATTKGGSLTMGPGKPPLSTKIKETATGGHVGFEWHPNPWFSDVQEFWEPRMGEPGEWLGGIANVVVDTAYNSHRFLEHVTKETRSTSGREWSQTFHDTIGSATFGGWADSVLRSNQTEWVDPDTPFAPMGSPGSLNW